MPRPPRILVVGTADTKSDELRYLSERVAAAGGLAATMDVGVLGTPTFAPDVRNAEVAAAAGTTLAAIAALGDENAAMARMAEGAAAIVRREHAAGRLDGVLALGGTMGTDLALDVCAALPLGVPKVVVSTVSFSHLIPPERIAPDLTMIGWPGGLYGLNATCRAALSQAAGAVVGACLAAEPPAGDRPSVAISSLGTSCLSYVRTLNPALEARGYEVAVFHCTGMGGRAMEALAAEGRFAAVLDLCLQELGNALAGSVVTAGDARLTGAGRRGVPQIVAPGAIDMIDLPSWRPLPEAYAGRPYHAHNRLIGSVTATADERRRVAREIGERLGAATGPTAFVLPLRGVQQWDREGEPLRDPAGITTFVEAARDAVRPPVECVEVDAHVNDPAFCDAVLAVFDRWVAEGRVAPGAPGR
ncbi:MAG: Tm-1-like ATP-binding domain-containing protein [Burkholderiaceae bacterium]|jgi:uncharacterized protein (UPF0261 family)|nr:Tm-1-like ATP-binding domain-containing protein [Burkholderiales bacterium]MCZ8107872.1 Tm-1-like ATP-binding domain-containing protein [Burkholderiales bacterium]MCZ8340765.1 Tm-1-like ATP-binding domain-containing protein [Burkholderiaceae bacterium]